MNIHFLTWKLNMIPDWTVASNILEVLFWFISNSVINFKQFLMCHRSAIGVRVPHFSGFYFIYLENTFSCQVLSFYKSQSFLREWCTPSFVHRQHLEMRPQVASQQSRSDSHLPSYFLQLHLGDPKPSLVQMFNLQEKKLTNLQEKYSRGL